VADAYRRLRNTARFLLANLHDFNPEADCVVPNEMLALDRWVVDRAFHLQKELIEAYDTYSFHVVYQKLHHFCAMELGGLYLDIIILWKPWYVGLLPYSVLRLRIFGVICLVSGANRYY